MGAALGEAEGRSALGEPLDVRIPLTPSGGEALDPAAPDPAPATPSRALRASLLREAGIDERDLRAVPRAETAPAPLG